MYSEYLGQWGYLLIQPWSQPLQQSLARGCCPIEFMTVTLVQCRISGCRERAAGGYCFVFKHHEKRNHSWKIWNKRFDLAQGIILLKLNTYDVLLQLWTPDLQQILHREVYNSHLVCWESCLWQSFCCLDLILICGCGFTLLVKKTWTTYKTVNKSILLCRNLKYWKWISIIMVINYNYCTAMCYLSGWHQLLVAFENIRILKWIEIISCTGG